MGAVPFVKSWQAGLMQAAIAAGHAVEVRRNRLGSTVWRIDGGRWIFTGPATTKMEIIVYGKANP
ncbi:MAG: hypothetical protein EOS20_17285 [Mesorhizobium sp.]|uniref:hypothetical protein n=1 Tax=Mesorhizobium sp. TaxID=1871066 RepID=UPI000FE4CA2C|nr:hypothetical protein [Mesorhizobium sp.]RWQ35827.1 MAG: hypothetical protein EOS20_17285 [Mesorhizobium sp.]